MSPTEEAIKYFKERAGFSRLFFEFGKRIESLGGTGGNVVLTKLNKDEQVVLRNWFQKDFSTQKSAKISLTKFEEKFKESRFEGASLFKVVEGVIGKKLTYKKDEEFENQIQKETFFKELERKYRSEATAILTDAILEKHPLHVGFIAEYNKGEFKEIEKIYKALSILPIKKPIRLPVFAERVSGNPHEFDNESKFISALQIVREKQYGIPVQNNNKAEHINQLLFDFGILKDDITNYVTTYGFMAERNENVLRSWEESFFEKSVRNETLREVAKLDRVYPIQKNNPVFVVENSGVFSSIVDELQNSPISIICTHGQFKIAALQIIKLLAKEDCTIYYSGDFDPEGILMAYSLKKRYPTNIRYWRYAVEDYINTLSNVELPFNRLKKLKSIEDNKLNDLVRQMQEIKKAAYQERQLKQLIKDVKDLSIN